MRLAQLYWAARPVTAAGEQRVRWERDAPAARKALVLMLRHFDHRTRPPELRAAHRLLRTLARRMPTRPPELVVDETTGETVRIHSGRGPSPEFELAVGELRAYGMTRDGAHAVLRAVGFTEIRLPDAPEFD